MPVVYEVADDNGGEKAPFLIVDAMGATLVSRRAKMVGV